MTLAEQTNALELFGYTAREASFLVTAALHSGYFVMRQLTPHRGKVAERFERKMVSYQHASVSRCGSNTHLFHLRAKSLYRALGQENNRHRRGHSPFHVRAKVMGLDYVLQHPGFRFLPTEEEKLTFFCNERNLSKSLLPTKTYAGKGSETDRFFVDKYPIRVDPETGNVSFCFIDDGAFSCLGFDTWLGQYALLARQMSGVEIVYVSGNPTTFEAARKQFEKQFSTVTSGATSADLLAYFELRKDFDGAGFRGRSQAVLDTMKRLRRTFSDTRFDGEYTSWLSGSQPVQSGPKITFSTYYLNHSYRFLKVRS